MNVGEIRKIYLIGICGTAMASLAGLLKQRGYDVFGSDQHIYPPMSTLLDDLGIPVFTGYRAQNIANSSPDIVIPGNAIPRGNPEVEEVLNRRLPYMSVTQAIRDLFLREKRSLIIAGTHGKTTTGSLAAWLLEHSGHHPSFLIGGIPINFGRSFQWNESSPFFVIEGDEYDTGFMDRRPKFVSYLPDTVLLNPVEYDHADLYPDFAAVENAFWQLIKVVPGNGKIIVNRDSEPAFQLAIRGYSEVITFGYHPESDYRITNEQWQNGEAQFHLNADAFRIRVFGKHNVANAAGVATMGMVLGLEHETIQNAFSAFLGVKRRMELRGEAASISVFDDFAHHPTAIRTTLEGARIAFPDSRIWGIFEPRSWSSRRNVFQKEFARAFDPAHLAVIAGVFEPEKLDPENRLDPDQLVSDIQINGTPAYYIPETEKLLSFVLRNAQSGDKLILMSNGSFHDIHSRILEGLRSRI